MTKECLLKESLLFERTTADSMGIDFFSSDDIKDDEIDIDEAIRGHKRSNPPLLPSLSEPELVRHFTRLSQKNFSIDTNSYPLGSCTMKYNPKIHEWAASLPGLNDLHPYEPEINLQIALKIYYELAKYISIISGFYKTSLAPSAGAQAEFAGIAMIMKALKQRGEHRSTILVPTSAHGTNPATAAFFSLKVIPINIDESGRIIKSQILKYMDDSCVGLMVTNPSTLGIYENELMEIAKVIHNRGGYVYGDGANLNALMGITKPHDVGIDVMHFNLHKTLTTPHGGGGPGCGALSATKELSSFLPTPYVEQKGNKYTIIKNTPLSIGRIRSFLGNFGMMIRAWVYIKSLGHTGVKNVSRMAVLNANYLRACLKDYYHVPYQSDCLHEVVLSDKYQRKYGVCALDIAKRLIDYKVHPPTMYFPLVVKGALMIEPTETESIYELDNIVKAFINIADEARNTPELVKTAPHTTELARLDEAQAARKPVLTFKASS